MVWPHPGPTPTARRPAGVPIRNVPLDPRLQPRERCLPCRRERGAADAAAEAAAAAAAAGRIIYFDFDSSEIRPEYADLVAAQARRLATSPAQRVRLEGHTDERGSREYNIALGERRAQAVRRALLLQGVADGQVVTISYGEERPAVEGQDEAANQKNRRVEFVDAG